MRKFFNVLLACALLAGLFAGCTQPEPQENPPTPVPQVTDETSTPAPQEESTPTPDAQNKKLTIFTWEGMFPPELLDGFEKETGYKINFVPFDLDETMLMKLQVAQGGEYDLIIADDYIIETVIAENLAQKLDVSKLSNYGNINPAFLGQFFDPTNSYAFPYGAGVQTIVYDPSRVDIDITGYADLWNAALKDEVGVIGAHRVINGMALKVLGKSYNTENLDDIQAAGDKLLELAPNIRLIKDDSIDNDLLAGEISAAVMYTSQVTLAKLENPDLKVVYPKEGIGFGIMAGFIPSNAPNAEAAYKFIDYILNADNAKIGYEWLGYYSTNQAADALIDEAYRDFLTLPQGLEGMEMIQNISPEAEDLHVKIWIEFEAACGE